MTPRLFTMRFFLVVLGLLSLALIVQSLQPATPQSAVPASPSYDLPIIDAHGHLQGKMSAEDLIKLMDLAGVSRIVLQPSVGLGSTDEQALDYTRRFPGRFIPFIGFQDGPLATPGELWLAPNQQELNFLSQVEGKLGSGRFFGWGEIVLRYYGHEATPAGGKEPEINRPADSPLMFRIADLATRYRAPMNIHAEGEPLVVAAMGRLLSTHPDAQVIWAHNCGRQSAAEIRRLLNGHPNLFCDLGGMTNTRDGYGSGWPRTMPWTFLVDDPSGQLFPEMKELFEEFPDRFMVGMDVYFLNSYQFYLPRALRFRRWFPQLEPTTAAKLAHENAERILRLPPLVK